uniref:Uncharacterized protein n=1 Tax=Arundo donax TaxID=35708 RepID=A0A0A9B8Z2_ARUDO
MLKFWKHFCESCKEILQTKVVKMLRPSSPHINLFYCTILRMSFILCKRLSRRA